MKRILQFALCCLLSLSTFAQPVTLTSNGTSSGGVSYGNGNVLTFSVRNNNGYDINITDIGMFHYQFAGGTASYQLYYTTDPTQAVATSVTNVTAAPWTFFGPSPAVAGSSPQTVKPIFTNIKLTVPGNTIMRLAMAWTSANVNGTTFMGNMNLTTGQIVSNGGVDLLCGGSNGISNHLRAPSYPGAGATSNGWVGYVTFEQAALPCDDTTITIAKTVGPNRVCPNKPYGVSVRLPNGLVFTGLTYQWQYSYNGTNWANFIGVPDPNKGGEIRDSITQDKWYRCVIKCQASNETYTTPPHKVEVAPFYYCYCDNEVTSDAGADIGNLTIIKTGQFDSVYKKGQLVTGSATPVYSNKESNRKYTSYHDSLGWPCLYRDTTYLFYVTQIHSGSSFETGVVQAYIDYNRDGLYNPNTERVFVRAMDGLNTNPHIVQVTGTVPANAQIGPTGMRLIISKDTVKGAPCDTISGGGEVEDYIVEICHRPCTGPVNAGIVTSTDTSMCTGYEYTLTDTTYEKARSGFMRAWQVSGDNSTWFNIPNSMNKDTLQRVFSGQPLYYRLRTICAPTHDTNYSAGTLINTKPGYKCYCYSKAVGGLNIDTSDIGGVTIADYSSNAGGPHLLNAGAVKPRTDFTDINPINLFIDSVYEFSVFHTMPVVEHGDAKVTIFMDFNNNHKYDIPEERIYTGYTAIGNHTLVDNVIIPLKAITDVPTGMRVIINNDVGPNVPSDSACGPYTSGETEDYVLIFRKAWPAGINGQATLTGFNVHPNPTSGKFYVQFNTQAEVKDVQVRVTNVTGQLIQQQSYTYEGGMFYQELDMTGQPSGVYFVELQAEGQKLMRKLVVQ